MSFLHRSSRNSSRPGTWAKGGLLSLPADWFWGPCTTLSWLGFSSLGRTRPGLGVGQIPRRAWICFLFPTCLASDAPVGPGQLSLCGTAQWVHVTAGAALWTSLPCYTFRAGMLYIALASPLRSTRGAWWEWEKGCCWPGWSLSGRLVTNPWG